MTALSREECLKLLTALLQRARLPEDGRNAFRQAYPAAPEAMVSTAAFHVFVDGVDAVATWLAEAELFLRDARQPIRSGTTWHLLHHVYNWHLFEALLPHGKSELMGLLSDLKQAATDGELEEVRATVREIEAILEGNQDAPLL